MRWSADTGLAQGNGRFQVEPSELIASGGNPFAAEALHLREILGIVRRRWAVVALVTVVMSSAVAAWLWVRPRLYQATAAVLIVDARRSLAGPILNEPTGRGVGRLTDPIRSHIQVLQGRSVLGKAVDEEGLRLVPSSAGLPRRVLSGIAVADTTEIDVLELSFSPDGLVARTGAGEVRAVYGERIAVGGVAFVVDEAPPITAVTLRVIPRESAIDRLTEQLRVVHRTGTDVIEISYTSPDPSLAQRVVNTVAEVFRTHNLEMVQQQTKLRRVFLEDQLRSTSTQLDLAQQALNGFRQSRQVYRSTDQLSAHQQALMTLDLQRSEVEADRGMYRSLLDTLRRSAGGERRSAIRTLVSSPGIASNPVVAHLYAQLVDQETRRDELTTGPLGSTRLDPDVERLDRLIAATEQKLTDASESHVASLEARLRALDELRARTAAEMQALPQAEAEESRLLQDIQTIGNLAEAIRADLERSRMAEAIETGQVEILHLAPPARPVYAGRRKRVLLAMILGVMFGGGAAFVMEFMDGTVRRRGEVEAVLRLPCLAVIPPMSTDPRGEARLSLPRRVGARRRGSARKRINPPAPGFGEGTEAFRRLRNNLFLAATCAPGKNLMVTSASPGEGKTLTAACLAVAVARQGRRVLVVDLDLQRPGLHEIFQHPLIPGVSEVLLRRASLGDAIRDTAVEHLRILPAGELSPLVQDLFSTDGVRAFLASLAVEYDLVILDTPPVLAVADVMAFAEASDSVLLVLRAGSTRPDTVQQAVEELSRVGARLVGAVIADPDRKVLEEPGFYEDYAARPV